jgi:hypothetical protein
MLSTILSSIGGAFISHFFDAAKDIFHDYQQGKITAEECKTRLLSALLESAKAIEVSHSETLAKTYASFMDALKVTPILQKMWAWTVGTQLFILCWSQFFVPLLFAYGWLPSWKAGTTGEWAYLLLGACLGFGPLVLRNGPGAISPDRLKALISK